jgi:hypothetical protein
MLNFDVSLCVHVAGVRDGRIRTACSVVSNTQNSVRLGKPLKYRVCAEPLELRTSAGAATRVDTSTSTGVVDGRNRVLLPVLAQAQVLWTGETVVCCPSVAKTTSFGMAHFLMKK